MCVARNNSRRRTSRRSRAEQQFISITSARRPAEGRSGQGRGEAGGAQEEPKDGPAIATNRYINTRQQH
jgi:hypothetical protein